MQRCGGLRPLTHRNGPAHASDQHKLPLRGQRCQTTPCVGSGQGCVEKQRKGQARRVQPSRRRRDRRSVVDVACGPEGNRCDEKHEGTKRRAERFATSNANGGSHRNGGAARPGSSTPPTSPGFQRTASREPIVVGSQQSGEHVRTTQTRRLPASDQVVTAARRSATAR